MNLRLYLFRSRVVVEIIKSKIYFSASYPFLFLLIIFQIKIVFKQKARAMVDQTKTGY